MNGQQRLMVSSKNRLIQIHNYLRQLIHYKKRITTTLEFFEILYKSDLGLIFDALTSVNKLGFYNNIIREILNNIHGNGYGYFSERIIYSYIKKVIERDIVPVAKVDYSKIGLYIAMIYVKDKIVKLEDSPKREWLLSYQPIVYPLGTMLIYYIPRNYADELIKLIIYRLHDIVFPEKIFVKIYEYSERFQPYFHAKISPYLTDNFIRMIKGYSSEELENIVEKLDDRMYDIGRHDQRIDKPNDIIDLILLKEFQINAFNTLNNIVSEYNIPYKTLRKHLEKHIIYYGLIDGIFLPSSIFFTLVKRYHLISLSFTDRERFIRAINFFKNIVYTGGLYYSCYSNTLEYSDNDRYELLALIYSPMEKDAEFYSFLSKISENGKLWVYYPSQPVFTKYSIPYTNFNQESKNWTLNTEESYKLYVRRLLL